MPLPHFTNITTSSSLYEPVYPSLFEITFVLPQLLQAEGRDPLMLLENALSVSLDLTTDITPGSQRFKYSTRVFLTMPEKTDVAFEIKFNVNVDNNGSVFVWNTLRSWYDKVWNSQNGTLHYKREIVGTIIVNQHDRKGFVIRRVTFYDVQLNGISGYSELDWDKSTTIGDAITGKFIADYWVDEYIDNSFQIVPPNIY